MRTSIAISRLSTMFRSRKLDVPDEPVLLDFIQQADQEIHRICTKFLGATNLAFLTATIGTTTGYDYDSDGRYPLPTGIPFHRLNEIRINDNEAVLYGTRKQLETYGTTAKPAYRILAPESVGQPQRIEIYPLPATDGVILFEYRQDPRKPDIFREAVGDLNGTNDDWTKTSGRWPYGANELVGAVWDIMAGGETTPCTVTTNTAEGVVSFDDVPTGLTAYLRCEFDIPSDLSEDFAGFLVPTAFEIYKNGRITEVLHRDIKRALTELDEPGETIPEPATSPYFRNLQGGSFSNSDTRNDY